MGDPLADQILGLLRANPDGLTRTELRDHFSRNRGADRIEQALYLLAELGLARKTIERVGVGRPTERWSATSNEPTRETEK